MINTTSARRLLRKQCAIVLTVAIAVVGTSCSRGGEPAADPDAPADTSSWQTYASHAALVEAAQTEGNLKVLTGLDNAVNERLAEGFMAKYPFIKASVTQGASDEAQKTILAIQAGKADFDVLEFSQPPDYPKFLPFIAPLDILKMAQEGTLNINKEMINPKWPNTVAFGSEKGVGVAYNKELVSEDDVPTSYEDMLDPKYKGQFLFSVETRHVAALAEVWGEQKMLEWAAAIAKQSPVWTDSNTGGLTTMLAGEHPYFFMPHLSSVLRLAAENPNKMGYRQLNPVPVHLGEIYGILKDAKHPASALLFFEYMAGPEAQQLLRDLHPQYSSVYADEAANTTLFAGNEPAITGWESMDDMLVWNDKILKEWGFPTAVEGK